MRVKAIYSLSHNLNWNECVPASLRLWSNWHSCRISLLVTRQKLLNGFLTRMRSKRKWIDVHENLKLYKSRLLALKSFLLSVSVVLSVGPWKNPSLHKIHIFSHLIKISRNPPHQFSRLYHTGTVSVSYSRTIGQIQDIRTTNAATYVVLPYFRIHILKILDFSLFWFRPANLFVVLWSPV